MKGKWWRLKKEEGKEKPKQITFAQLFRYADTQDKWWMTIGTADIRSLSSCGCPNPAASCVLKVHDVEAGPQCGRSVRVKDLVNFPVSLTLIF